MNNLTFRCIDDLPQPESSCTADYGEAIKIILSRTPVLSVGEVPTANEFANAYDAGQIVILSGFTNFRRVKVGSTSIEGNNGPELYDGEYSITGRIKRLNAAIVRLTEILDRYPTLYMYYLTDEDWCFGVYKSDPFFSIITQNVTPVYVDFKFNFVDIGIDYKQQDNYSDLPNLFSYLMTEDTKHILTEDEKVIIF